MKKKYEYALLHGFTAGLFGEIIGSEKENRLSQLRVSNPIAYQNEISHSLFPMGEYHSEAMTVFGLLLGGLGGYFLGYKLYKNK